MKTIKEMKTTPKPQPQNEDNHKTEGDLKDEDHLKKHWNQLYDLDQNKESGIWDKFKQVTIDNICPNFLDQQTFFFIFFIKIFLDHKPSCQFQLSPR